MNVIKKNKNEDWERSKKNTKKKCSSTMNFAVYISTYTNHLWINLCRNCYSRVSWICRLISFAINCALRRVIAIIEFIYIAMSTILASYFYRKLYLPFSNNEIKISEPFLHFIFVMLIASMKNLKYFGFIFHSLQKH